MSTDKPERVGRTQEQEIEYLAKRLCRLSDRCKGRMRHIRNLERALEHEQRRHRDTIETILRVLKPEEQEKVVAAISVQNMGMIVGMPVYHPKGKP
jgi:hypothetical protein